MTRIRPLFLFSLPRSGSTLVQRVLGAHPMIATASEPWLLLPYVHIFHPEGVRAIYNHRIASEAIGHFCREALPGGLAEYRDAVREHILDVYRRAAGRDATYFLDKTPRYAMVAAKIVRLFPDARYVFLWRNPLATAASMIELFGGGSAHLLHYPTSQVDLRDGLDGMVEGFREAGDRALGVRYEDLIRDPERSWRRLFEYLGLEYRPEVLTGFKDLRFRMGDPIGTDAYDRIDDAPLEKWKATMENPYRRFWCRRYLRWIGAERLRTMGYDPDALLKELAAEPPRMRGLGRDLVRLVYGRIRLATVPRLAPDRFALLSALDRRRPGGD